MVLDAQTIAEEGATMKPKETPERHQVGEANSQGVRRELRGGYTDQQLSSVPLDMSAEELKQLVKLDPSLKNL